jgi:hypothetical protein
MLYSLSEPTKSVVGVKTSPRERRRRKKCGETEGREYILIIFNCTVLDSPAHQYKILSPRDGHFEICENLQ